MQTGGALLNTRDDDDWLDAAAAYQLAFERSGQMLGRNILERARDGIVRARATHYIATGPKRGRLESSRETRRLRLHELPSEFFWAGGNEALNANWTTGDFSTWVDGWDCRAYGVQFMRSDIVAMTPIVPSLSVESQLQKVLPKHSSTELDDWIRAAPMAEADLALNFYKLDARYNGIKQTEFRARWKEIKRTKQGAQPRPKS